MAVRTQSIAVSPPPMTTTRLPSAFSSPESNSGTSSPKAFAVGGGEVIQRADDAFGTDAGGFDVAGFVNSGGDQNGVVLATDGVEGQVFADFAVQHEGDACDFKLFDALHDHRLFQFETGDAVGQQAAGAVVAVIDGDLHAGAAQNVGGGKATGASADDADGFGALGAGGDRFDPAHFPRLVGEVFFDRADGDGAVAGLFNDAVAFAEAVLRADAAADFREGVGGLATARRLLPGGPRRSGAASRGCCCAAGNATGNRARRIGCTATACSAAFSTANWR